jgi:hypothetical protein
VERCLAPRTVFVLSDSGSNATIAVVESPAADPAAVHFAAAALAVVHASRAHC